MEDVQSRPDDRGIQLDRAGVSGLRYPVVVLDRKRERQQTIATISMSVGVPHHSKGTHMSRFVEVLNEHRGEVTMRTLPKILRRLLEHLDAETARIELAFPYFMERAAPATGASGLMDYACRFVATTGSDGDDFVLGVRVPVTSLCPCSKAISDYGAHNQRGTITLDVRPQRSPDTTPELIWLEELHCGRGGQRLRARVSRPQAARRTACDDAGLREPGLRRGHGEERRCPNADRSPHRLVPRPRRESGEHPQSRRVRRTAVDAPRAGMNTTLHIIAGCTDRKRLRAGSPMQLRAVADEDVAAQLGAWWTLLTKAGSPRLAARELYVGGHWAVVRELPSIARRKGFDPTLWVASAGYGFLRADDAICAYSATFAPGHEDSVAHAAGGAGAKAVNRRWWALLSKRRLSGSAPRSVSALARSDPDATFLVIASPWYLTALRDDLLGALHHLGDPERLLIVSSGNADDGRLTSNLVPSTARLLSVHGVGNRISLHAQTARRILKTAKPGRLTAGAVRKRYERLNSRLPPPTLPDRSRRTDDEVRRFIGNALRRSPTTSRTSLLRDFRNAGHQCEQKRFSRLFGDVVRSRGAH